MAGRTHYQVMMLDPTATPVVINAVYRALAKQYHPDRAGSTDAGKMTELNEAYAILSDPEKRSRYDLELRRRDGAEMVSIKVTPDEPPASDAARAGRPAGSRAAPSPEDPIHRGTGTQRASNGPAPPASEFGEAGAPPAFLPRRGTTITFGRYRGWTVSQVAAYDRDYVEWLSRSQAGRAYRDEAKRFLGQPAST